MKMKKLFASALTVAMLAGSFSGVLAAPPSYYDGQNYESVGYTSEDSDGEINLAVTANGDVKFVGDGMYIMGSVYTTGDIYVGNGAGNKIDGFFISHGDGSLDSGEGTIEDRDCPGYIHVNDDGTRDTVNAYSTTLQYEGSVIDLDTSFECEYEEFEVPEIANDLGEVEMNIYGNEWADTLPRTITEDTKISKLSINGTAMTIDTTNGDVSVVIDEIVAENSANPGFMVVGENDAYIYINNIATTKDFSVNYDNSVWPSVVAGNVERTHLYLTNEDSVFIGSTRMAVADLTVKSKSLTVTGSSVVTADIYTNAESFELFGDTSITGVVCAPYAASRVVDTGTLYGQLHTNSLEMNGNGSIIYKADKAAAIATPEPTAEPTEPPLLPSGPIKDYEGFKYAYIFGYEPYNTEDGELVLEMAPEEAMTREQICAMLVRVDDQYNDKIGKTRYLEDGIFDENATSDRWSYNALAAVAESQAFEGKTDLDPAGNVSRGEVARIVAFMMGLNEYDDEIAFADAVGNENEVYIKIIATAGYMQGYEDGMFRPDSAITRAEFCAVLNNIIGRTADEGYVLQTADGTPVTHETYSFTDLSPSAWYYDTVLYATSAFDGCYVDFETRMQNIRNKLDGFDAQFDY